MAGSFVWISNLLDYDINRPFMNTSLTTEERFWAILSHLSALALGMGILLPVIGWSEQRGKSKYTSFQCLQALGYQSLGYTVWLLAYVVVFIVWMLLVILMSYQAGINGRLLRLDEDTIVNSMLITLIVFLGIYMILPVIAAVACGLGRDFRYPVLGTRLARYLGYSQGDDSTALSADHEDRWVAAMGHFSVIIVLWGILAPLAVWVSQAKSNRFLRFHAIQTTLYQILVNVLYVGALLLALFGAAALFAMTGLEGAPNQSSSTGMAGLILFFISMLIASVILLIIPLFHILGQWAGYRLLKGNNYRYPLLGNLVERWMEKREPHMEVQQAS